MDAVAPTPVSSTVSITPVTRSTRGDANDSGARFIIDLRIRNTGSRTIFLDRLYGRTEKLIDQKWEFATETTTPAFGSVRAIGAGQSFTLTYQMLYVKGRTPPSIHLEHIRGLYRARLRFSFTSSGSDPFPAEESYSQPFAVE
jgi:hypothetical protein